MVSLIQSTSGPYLGTCECLCCRTGPLHAREKIDPSGGQLALLGALAANTHPDRRLGDHGMGTERNPNWNITLNPNAYSHLTCQVQNQPPRCSKRSTQSRISNLHRTL